MRMAFILLNWRLVHVVSKQVVLQLHMCVRMSDCLLHVAEVVLSAEAVCLGDKKDWMERFGEERQKKKEGEQLQQLCWCFLHRLWSRLLTPQQSGHLQHINFSNHSPI